MAVEMFLDLDGIKGEAQTKGFENKIDIHSFSFGASNPSQIAAGTGGGSSKVSLSSVSIQKVVDLATPDLFRSCCSGKHIAKGKITIREAGGDAPVDYLVIDLTQVFIDGISWGSASGGDKPSESVSLSAASVKLTYSAQTAQGSSQKGPSAGWDVKKNELVA